MEWNYFSEESIEQWIPTLSRKIKKAEKQLSLNGSDLAHWIFDLETGFISFLQIYDCNCAIIIDEIQIPQDWHQQVRRLDTSAFNEWIDEMELILKRADLYKRRKTYNGHLLMYLVPAAWAMLGGGCDLCCQDED